MSKLGLRGFSIVLCTYNGKDKLLPTLQHLALLQIPKNSEVEILLIDNASTDGTSDFVSKTWTELGAPYTLEIIREIRPGKGYAVETGYDAAKCSYILTVDDDNWLRNDYLVNASLLFENDPSIGILQGESKGVFESSPPDWFEKLKHYFIIGSPIEEVGFFSKNNFFVWGAGMIIRREDWINLRHLGYYCLTSKLPGKAAGEDNEVAIALLILGKKIYYSNNLSYEHYMPTDRLQWDKLKKNFETFGYVSHYFFLYGMVLDAYDKNYKLTNAVIRRKFRKYWFNLMRPFTIKQHIAYWVLPRHEYYQLILTHYYSHYKWYTKLSGEMMKDVKFLQSWLLPIYSKNPDNFSWPVAL